MIHSVEREIFVVALGASSEVVSIPWAPLAFANPLSSQVMRQRCQSNPTFNLPATTGARKSVRGLLSERDLRKPAFRR